MKEISNSLDDSAGGSYTAMNNKNLQSYIDIDQIINMQLSVTNIRPISKKWLLLTTVGAGVYASSDVKLKNVLDREELFSSGSSSPIYLLEPVWL